MEKLGQIELVLGRTCVQAIPGKGRGIIAREPIGRGEVIEENLCLPLDAVDAAAVNATRLRHYVYFWSEGEGGDHTALLRQRQHPRLGAYLLTKAAGPRWAGV